MVTVFVSGDTGLKVLDVGGGSGLVVHAVSGAYSSRFLSVPGRCSDYCQRWQALIRFYCQSCVQNMFDQFTLKGKETALRFPSLTI